jgi:hypothetical protein
MHFMGDIPRSLVSRKLGGYTPSWDTRLRALLRRPMLDRSLAEGQDPTTAASRWRARQLTSPRRRRKLAASLERTVEVAEAPQAFRGSAVPLNRDEVLRCRALLFGIAADLTDDAPVTPQGVLMLQKLLRDGGSPLYTAELDGALEFELRCAHTALVLR